MIPVATSCADNENITTKKLLNSSFEMFESNGGILTRQQAKEVGIGFTSDVEMATGFKLQDAVLLNECISKAAICISCRQPTSNFQLYQRNVERKGLSGFVSQMLILWHGDLPINKQAFWRKGCMMCPMKSTVNL